MAIQFFCVACRQPIEVDDEFANQPVTCPYCKKVVTTPEVSDPAIAQKSAEARATGGMPHDLTEPVSGQLLQQNKWGWVALGCVTGAFIAFSILCGNSLAIFRQLPPDTTPEQAQKVLVEELQTRTGMQIISMIGIVLLPIVGVASAVYGLIRRSTPRWPSIAAIVVLAPLVLCVCLSILMNLAQSMTQGAAGG